jgi:hypothetical protein
VVAPGVDRAQPYRHAATASWLLATNIAHRLRNRRAPRDRPPLPGVGAHSMRDRHTHRGSRGRRGRVVRRGCGSSAALQGRA